MNIINILSNIRALSLECSKKSYRLCSRFSVRSVFLIHGIYNICFETHFYVLAAIHADAVLILFRKDSVVMLLHNHYTIYFVTKTAHCKFLYKRIHMQEK